MRILLVGATGRTGRLVLEGALGRGHEVTALVRKNTDLAPTKGLTVIQGDVLSPGDLRLAIPGCDVVVSVLGRHNKADRTLLQDGARAMLAALPSTSSRYIVVSQGLLFPSMNPMIAVLRFVLAAAVADSRAMEFLVKRSALEWTIVRPPQLTNGMPRTYRACVGNRPRGALSMARIDLAAFLLDEVDQAKFRRTVVGVG